MQCFCVSQHTASLNKIRTHQTDMRETKVKIRESGDTEGKQWKG